MEKYLAKFANGRQCWSTTNSLSKRRELQERFDSKITSFKRVIGSPTKTKASRAKDRKYTSQQKHEKAYSKRRKSAVIRYKTESNPTGKFETGGTTGKVTLTPEAIILEDGYVYHKLSNGDYTDGDNLYKADVFDYDQMGADIDGDGDLWEFSKYDKTHPNYDNERYLEGQNFIKELITTNDLPAQYATGGLTEHGLKVDDKIISQEKGSNISVSPADSKAEYSVNLDTGKRKEVNKQTKFIEYGYDNESGEKLYTYRQTINRVKTLLKDDQDLWDNYNIRNKTDVNNLSDDKLLDIGNQWYEIDEAETYKKGGYLVFNYTDNVMASPKVFKTKNAANDFIKAFRKRYEAQGYYRDNSWNKISPKDIEVEVIDEDFQPMRFDHGGKTSMIEKAVYYSDYLSQENMEDLFMYAGMDMPMDLEGEDYEEKMDEARNKAEAYFEKNPSEMKHKDETPWTEDDFKDWEMEMYDCGGSIKKYWVGAVIQGGMAAHAIYSSLSPEQKPLAKKLLKQFAMAGGRPLKIRKIIKSPEAQELFRTLTPEQKAKLLQAAATKGKSKGMSKSKAIGSESFRVAFETGGQVDDDVSLMSDSELAYFLDIDENTMDRKEAEYQARELQAMESEEFETGGKTKKFPIAVKRRVDEINKMLPIVNESGNYASSYAGSTMESYIILKKPIEIKGNYVYITEEKSSWGNYGFEKRYNVNDTQDDYLSQNGRKALMYDLGIIKRAFTKLLKSEGKI